MSESSNRHYFTTFSGGAIVFASSLFLANEFFRWVGLKVQPGVLLRNCSSLVFHTPALQFQQPVEDEQEADGDAAAQAVNPAAPAPVTYLQGLLQEVPVNAEFHVGRVLKGFAGISIGLFVLHRRWESFELDGMFTIISLITQKIKAISQKDLSDLKLLTCLQHAFISNNVYNSNLLSSLRTSHDSFLLSQFKSLGEDGSKKLLTQIHQSKSVTDIFSLVSSNI